MFIYRLLFNINCRYYYIKFGVNAQQQTHSTLIQQPFGVKKNLGHFRYCCFVAQQFVKVFRRGDRTRHCCCYGLVERKKKHVIKAIGTTMRPSTTDQVLWWSTCATNRISVRGLRRDTRPLKRVHWACVVFKLR